MCICICYVCQLVVPYMFMLSSGFGDTYSITSIGNVSDVLEDDLRNDYKKDKHSFDVDEWPPDQPKTVVNVALIHYKGSRTEQEFLEISKRHKEGTPAIDELVEHSRVTKDIYKIFQPDFTSYVEILVESPKFILIEGAPGIGKTVLAKKIAYLWAKRELLTNVNILFLLFLRDPKLQVITTPEQLIQYVSSKYLDEEQIKSCLKQIMGLQIGIVMDGFDEYPIELRKKSFIADLMRGKVFSTSVVVLTSRPTATLSLHNKVDRRVEILGFAQEERDKYICESLDSLEERKQLQDYLKCQPIINGLVYVPLHLAVLLYLFKFQSKLPETLTEMNELFILHTIYRSLSKDELIPTGPVTVVLSINGLQKEILDIVKGLSRLAFIGLQKNQLVFSYDEIEENSPEIKSDMPGAFNGFGLLQVVQYLPKRGAGVTTSFNFLHFTMQEFLAAYHVSNVMVNPCSQQLLLMERTFWDDVYKFMWVMYVGINGVDSRTFMLFLYKGQSGSEIRKLKLSNEIKSDKIKCLHLFQCFMEAKSKKVPKEVSNIFYNNEIDFHGLQLLPHHISSLTLYISKYSLQLETLNLRDCHIGDVGMSILEHYFTANPDKAVSIKHIDLFGNNSILLWNVYCAIFGQQNLTKLNWSLLTRVNVEEIVTVMNNNTTVQSLNISNNHFKNDDAERLAEVLSSNTTLQELDFSNNNITTRGAVAVSKYLYKNAKLQRLKMSWNNHFINTGDAAISFSHSYRLRSPDVQIVANILCKNETVSKLDLSRNKIFNNGAESISKCIECNRSLREIDISKNMISDVGFKKIAAALQKNHVIQKFNISHNRISDSGAITMSECLKDNNTLQELDISHNKICNTGFISIGKTLQINVSLQMLNISYNEISDEAIVTFGYYLKKKNTCNEIKISWNDGIYLVLHFMAESFTVSRMNLDDSGAILVSALLHGNSNLKKLDISHNNISNHGAISISECLKENNTLRELDMSFNEITCKGVVTILNNIENSSLHILNLTHNIISKQESLLICDLHQKLKNKCSLQISYNEIDCMTKNINTILVSEDDNEFDDVKLDMQNRKLSFKAKAICFCTKDHKELNISNHDVTSKEAKLIATAIEENASLQKLDISCNSISDDGAIAISIYLEHNTTLKQLNISHNQVSNSGIIRIAHALQMNAKLQILDISHNNISDGGAFAISDCLKINNTLQELDMSHNQVSNIGITRIGKTLQINTALKILDISHNNMTDNGAIVINEALRSHYKMKNTVTIKSGINNEENVRNYTPEIFTMLYNTPSENILALSDCLKNNNILQELMISWDDYETPVILNRVHKFCSMSGSHLGNTGTILTLAFLFQNDRTQKLDISNNNISDDGAIAISKYLSVNVTLNELNMSKNIITNHGMILMTEAIHANVTLRSLDISHNNITKCEMMVTVLRQSLKHNNTLQVLGISWNDSDAMYVYHVGTNNESYVDDTWPQSKLTKSNVHRHCHKEFDTYAQFDQCYNDTANKHKVLQFGDIEAMLLTALVHGNVDVIAIEITNSIVSDSAAIIISNFLEKNKTLEKLKVAHNLISSEGIKQILKAFHINNYVADS